MRVTGLHLAYGHVPLLEGVDLQLERGERVALVGRNGTGKSSLLKVLAGSLAPDSGNRWLADGVRVSYLQQEVPEQAQLSVFDLVSQGLGTLGARLAEYHRLSLRMADGNAADLDRLAELQTEIESQGGWNTGQRVEAILTRMNLPADKLMAECSGGIRRRAVLAQALVSDPEVLLLDEPTNHLDIAAIDALEELLLGFAGALVLVTHDRALIGRVATRIVELDRGRMASFPGDYATYLARKAQMLEAEAGSNAKFDRDLAQEEVWIRQGIKARRTRNEGRVRRLEQMRRERAERRGRQGQARLEVDRGEQSGALVAELENVSFGYGEPVIDDFSVRVTRGDRLGIIGPNGCGKSTLLRLLLGDLAPDAGKVTLGTRLNVAYFDQQRATLRLEESVRENLVEGSDYIDVGGRSRHVVGYLNDFLFPPARINSPVKSLSGGERNRLLLAKLFSQPANLMVLDEPTNDLDIETLELLEELLGDYDGTLLLVSHDRAFLDAVVTGIIAFEGEGRVREYVGGYTDWLRQRPAEPRPGSGSRGSAAPASKSSPAPAAAQSRPARRLSYKQQRELDALPDLIDELERRQADLQARIGAPEFYQGARDAISDTLAELARLDAEIAEAYRRWQGLEGE